MLNVVLTLLRACVRIMVTTVPMSTSADGVTTRIEALGSWLARLGFSARMAEWFQLSTVPSMMLARVARSSTNGVVLCASSGIYCCV